jgi:phosphomannomutase
MTISIKPGIFKANDIRGEYPSEINEKIVSEIAQHFSRYFKLQATSYKRQVKVVVAHDARLSSSSLYKAVITGLQDCKIARLKIIEGGLTTTPMFYFLVKKLKAVGGLMITASHNPPNYNGLKIVDENALPISGLEVKKLFKL